MNFNVKISWKHMHGTTKDFSFQEISTPQSDQKHILSTTEFQHI